MPLARLPDAELYYEILGEGPPVVLVAGLGGVGSYWQPNLAALKARHKVIVYDHRGTGRSSRLEQNYNVALLADDLARLLDAVGIERAALIGHSTGGAIGQVLAASQPWRVDRLLLYASWSILCQQMRQCMKIRQQLLMLGGAAGYHRSSPLFLYPPRYMCEAWDVIEREIAAAEQDSTTVSILAARLEAVLEFDSTSFIDDIKTPTTILVAQDDILTPPLASEVLRSRIKTARLHILPYGGHAVSRTDPVTFNKVALDFLE